MVQTRSRRGTSAATKPTRVAAAAPSEHPRVDLHHRLCDDDGAVPDDFLKTALSKEKDVAEPSYLASVGAIAGVCVQLCAVVLLFMFFHIFVESPSHTWVIVAFAWTLLCIVALPFVLPLKCGRASTAAAAATALVVQAPVTPTVTVRDRLVRAVGALRYSLVFALALSLAAPVLQTLTQTYATDSVLVQACLLCVVHLVFHDYAVKASQASQAHLPVVLRGTSALSVNAGIFAAIILSSRLRTIEQVFIFVLLAFQLFAGVPLFRQRLAQRAAPWPAVGHVAVPAVALAGTSAALWALWTPYLVPFGAAMCILLIILPGAHVWFHRFKRNRRGPWDVAHIDAAPVMD